MTNRVGSSQIKENNFTTSGTTSAVRQEQYDVHVEESGEAQRSAVASAQVAMIIDKYTTRKLQQTTNSKISNDAPQSQRYISPMHHTTYNNNNKKNLPLSPHTQQ